MIDSNRATRRATCPVRLKFVKIAEREGTSSGPTRACPRREHIAISSALHLKRQSKIQKRTEKPITGRPPCGARARRPLTQRMQVQGKVFGAAGLRLGYAETSKENPRRPFPHSRTQRERQSKAFCAVCRHASAPSAKMAAGGNCALIFQLLTTLLEAARRSRRAGVRLFSGASPSATDMRIFARAAPPRPAQREGGTYVQANARNVQERWSCYSFRVSGARRMDEAIHFWQRTGRHRPMGVATRQRLRRCVLSLRAPSHQNHVAGVENVLLARRCGGSKRGLPSRHLSSETLVLVAAAAAGGERWGWWSGKDELGRCNQSTPSAHVRQGGVFVPRGWAGTSASVTRVSNECWWC